MRSATARESTRHAALFCVGAGQWDQTIYNHTHPPPQMANHVRVTPVTQASGRPLHGSHLRRRRRFAPHPPPLCRPHRARAHLRGRRRRGRVGGLARRRRGALRWRLGRRRLRGRRRFGRGHPAARRLRQPRRLGPGPAPRRLRRGPHRGARLRRCPLAVRALASGSVRAVAPSAAMPPARRGVPAVRIGDRPVPVRGRTGRRLPALVVAHAHTACRGCDRQRSGDPHSQTAWGGQLAHEQHLRSTGIETGPTAQLPVPHKGHAPRYKAGTPEAPPWATCPGANSAPRHTDPGPTSSDAPVFAAAGKGRPPSARHGISYENVEHQFTWRPSASRPSASPRLPATPRPGPPRPSPPHTRTPCPPPRVRGACRSPARTPRRW